MSVNGEALGVAAGMGAAAMERGFLLESNTERVVGEASGAPGDTAACRGADRQPSWARQAAPCQRQGVDLVLSSKGP